MAMLMIFIALQLADIGTTLIGFGLGYQELNFIVRPLLGILGPLTGLFLIKAIAIAVAFWLYVNGYGRAVKWAIAFYVGVVAWNVYGIVRLVL